MDGETLEFTTDSFSVYVVVSSKTPEVLSERLVQELSELAADSYDVRKGFYVFVFRESDNKHGYPRQKQ